MPKLGGGEGGKEDKQNKKATIILEGHQRE
jgi:hypothetical protein